MHDFFSAVRYVRFNEFLQICHFLAMHFCKRIELYCQFIYADMKLLVNFFYKQVLDCHFINADKNLLVNVFYRQVLDCQFMNADMYLLIILFSTGKYLIVNS